MSKRLSVFILAAALIMFMLVAVRYVRESGLLRKYPKAEYFTEEEARLRPAYQQLTRKEQAVYHALYDGISQQKSSIALPCEISGETYSKIYCLVEKQESELFYVDSTYFTAEKIRDAKIAYRGGAEPDPEKFDNFQAAEIKAVNAVIGASDDYSKALAIHDYIVENCRYTVNFNEPYTSTAYGCLVEGRANCEGYAKAFRQIAKDCGLRCVLVTGVTDTGENHAWNQVEINGEWRNIDVTWDDSDIAGDTRRLYFLCSDAEFGTTHTPDNYGFVPFECGGSSNDYYIRSGKTADSMLTAEDIVRRAVASGQDVIEVKFTDDALYREFRSRYIEQNGIFDVLMSEGAGVYGNLSVTVRENEKERCITLVLNR